MKTSHKIIEHIKSQHLNPKSKGYFMLQEFFFMLGSTVMLFLSGLSLGSLFFQQSNQLILPQSYVQLALIFKALILIITLFVSLVLFRKISTLYRKSITLQVLFLGIAIVVLGLGLFFSQSISRFESVLGRVGIEQQIARYWSQPEKKGLFAGEFIEVTDSGLALVRGLNGGVVPVDVSQVNKNEQDFLFDYLRVGFVGYMKDGIFQACQIHPWRVVQGSSSKNKLYHQKEKEGNIFFGKGSQRETLRDIERNNPYLRSNRCEVDHKGIN